MTEAGNGFANRFIWVCARRSRILPEGGRFHEVNIDDVVRRLREAVEFGSRVDEIRRDEEARTLWHKVYPALSEGKPGLLGAVTARAEPQVMRLACVYAVLDSSEMVRKEHLEAALAVWRYCEDSARFIFGNKLGDPVADEILAALRQTPEGMTRTDIRDLFGRHRKGGDIGRALSMLGEQGLIYGQQEDTDGRPAERWFAVGQAGTGEIAVTEEIEATEAPAPIDEIAPITSDATVAMAGEIDGGRERFEL